MAAPAVSNQLHIDTLRDWSPLNPESLVAAPCLLEQTLCQCSQPGWGDDDDDIPVCADSDSAMSTMINWPQPQFAKDRAYGRAIWDAWQQQQDSNGNQIAIEWKSIRYRLATTSTDSIKSKDSNTWLYGHVIRNHQSSFWSSTSSEQLSAHKDGNPSSSLADAADDDHLAPSAPPVGVVLFPTGAGPHDVFLLMQSTRLIASLQQEQEQEQRNPVHVIVLIADMVSDATGWSWTDSDRNSIARQALLQATTASSSLYTSNDRSHSSVSSSSPIRPLLQHRIEAAIQTLQSLMIKDPKEGLASSSSSSSSFLHIAALGWCLGGHAILELSKMMKMPQRHQQQHTSQVSQQWIMSAMVTFHGVFAGGGGGCGDRDSTCIEQQQGDENDVEDEGRSQQQHLKQHKADTSTCGNVQRCPVLICHGVNDPFVPEHDLEQALLTFQYQPPKRLRANSNNNMNDDARVGVVETTVSLLQLPAQHGFTNPAQAYNDHPAFDYHEASAEKAWHQAMVLLRKVLL